MRQILVKQVCGVTATHTIIRDRVYACGRSPADVDVREKVCNNIGTILIEGDIMSEKQKIDAEPIRDARTLGAPKMILLGMQHLFAMFGATVLVPLLTGLDVSTTLLMAGLGTLLFHFITKGKVPAFLGSSSAYLGGYAIVAPLIDGKPNTEMLPYACGGVLVSGIVYLILAALFKAFGIKRVMNFSRPL